MNIKRIMITAAISIFATWAILTALYDHSFDVLCKQSHGITVQGHEGLICMVDQPVIAEQ